MEHTAKHRRAERIERNRAEARRERLARMYATLRETREQSQAARRAARGSK